MRRHCSKVSMEQAYGTRRTGSRCYSHAQQKRTAYSAFVCLLWIVLQVENSLLLTIHTYVFIFFAVAKVIDTYLTVSKVKKRFQIFVWIAGKER